MHVRTAGSSGFVGHDGCNGCHGCTDKEVLSQRIHQAVDLVCFQPEPRALQLWSQYRRCMQAATDSAWSQIRWPDTRVTVRNESVPPPPPPVP